MKLTIEDAEEQLHHIHTILTHINIYKYNLEFIIQTDFNNEFNGKHIDTMFFMYNKLLIIDINKLVYDCKKEKLNLFKISRSFNSTFKSKIDVKLLEENKATLEKIKNYRDTQYAHFDLKSDDKDFLVNDVFNIVEILNSIVKDISYKFNQGYNIENLLPRFNLFENFVNTYKVNKVQEALLELKLSNILYDTPNNERNQLIDRIIFSKSIDEIRSLKKISNE